MRAIISTIDTLINVAVSNKLLPAIQFERIIALQKNAHAQAPPKAINLIELIVIFLLQETTGI